MKPDPSLAWLRTVLCKGEIEIVKALLGKGEKGRGRN
jgi:hypothetical protein